MNKSFFSKIKILWPYAIAAIFYLLINNADTFVLPENLIVVQGVLSFLLSSVSAILCMAIVVALPILVFRMIQRKQPGTFLIWSFFLGLLFIVNAKFVRYYFLDISRDRSINNAQTLVKAINQYKIEVGNYPATLKDLVPLCVDSIPLPNSNLSISYRYTNFDSTFCISFDQWVGGRTYRSFAYSPKGIIKSPEYASEIKNTDKENWKYYYY